MLRPGSTTRVNLDAAQYKSAAVQGLTSINYGGLLWISNVAPGTVFTNGQSFRLFSSIFATGNFSQIQPGPGPGMIWQFDPATGFLTVLATPLLKVESALARTATISWPGQEFHLRVSTNSSGMTPNQTWFDYPGTSPVVLPIDGSLSNMFFRLISP